MATHSGLALVAGAALLLLTGCSDEKPLSDMRQEKVGLVSSQYHDDARDRPIAFKLWYPAVESAIEQPRRGLGKQFVAENADIKRADAPFPMVLLSHGTGGNYTSLAWLAEVLTSNGYMVAAVNHWQNTTDNNQPSGILRLWDRPRDLSFLLDELLQDGDWAQYIDAERVYAAGHSAGGFAVLGLVGARYSVKRMQAHCRQYGDNRDCRLVQDIDLSTIDLSDEGDPYRDHRIKAVLAMAPAVAPGVSVSSLQQIDAPVKIIASRNDEWLPHELHAARYADNIPTADLMIFDRGGHFLYLQTCSFIPKLIVRFTVDDDICGTGVDADRGAAHRQIARMALTFFGEQR